MIIKILVISICFISFAIVTQGQVIVPVQSGDSEAGPLLPMQLNDQWGYINNSGEIIIKPQFVSAGLFHEGRALVQLRSGDKSVFINEKGEVVGELKYDGIIKFSKDVTAVKIGGGVEGQYYVEGKWGVIDGTGKFIVNPQFDAIGEFSEDLAPIKIHNKWGFIDRTGEIIIKPQFKWVTEFSEGLAAADNGKVGFIDRTGRFVIRPRFNNARSFREGLAPVKNKKYGDWGYIDKTGKLVIDFKFVSAGSFSQGFASVFSNQSTSIDKTDKFVNKPGCNSFSEGLAPITVNGKSGYIDETGKIVIEPQWDLVTAFTGVVAAVVTFTKPGFQAGGIFVPGRIMIFDAVGKWGYINKTGKYIWKQE